MTTNQDSGKWVQVARARGNPLLNEALVAIADKDLLQSQQSSQDAVALCQVHGALVAELAKLINASYF